MVSHTFIVLLNVNLIVTADSFPNLKHLTGNRLELLNFFSIYKDSKMKKLKLEY